MYYESELYHHGTKGQKWGVRHGPPYPLSENTRTISREGQNITKHVSKYTSNKSAEKASSMSDEELKTAVRRMNLEQQYTNLSSKESANGLDYANSVLDVAGSVAAIGGGIASIIWAIKEIKKG